MSRLALLAVSILLLCVGGLLLSLNGCSGSGTTTGTVPPPAAKIQHVVIIFQENRTPDNLFQGLCIPPYGSASACSTNPSASQYDIASSGVDSTGATITLSPIDLGTAGTNGNPDNYDLSHAHSAFVDMCRTEPGHRNMRDGWRRPDPGLMHADHTARRQLPTASRSAIYVRVSE